MKAMALMLLCSCAPAMVQPSSLPAVLIDRNVTGVACSRRGAEVIAELRARERLVFEQRLVECGSATKLAQAGEAQAFKRSEANSWWATWGLPLGFLLGAFSGVAVGALARR